jgi:hypothetical protein
VIAVVEPTEETRDHLRTLMEAEEERDAMHRWERMTPEERWEEQQYQAEVYRNVR